MKLTRRGLEACFASGALEKLFYPDTDVELARPTSTSGSRGSRSSRGGRGRAQHAMLRASVLERASPPTGSADGRGSRSPSPQENSSSDGRTPSPQERSSSYIRRHANPWKRLSNVRRSRTADESSAGDSGTFEEEGAPNPATKDDASFEAEARAEAGVSKPRLSRRGRLKSPDHFCKDRVL